MGLASVESTIDLQCPGNICEKLYPHLYLIHGYRLVKCEDVASSHLTSPLWARALHCLIWYVELYPCDSMLYDPAKLALFLFICSLLSILLIPLPSSWLKASSFHNQLLKTYIFNFWGAKLVCRY